jgi:plasmid stabilization system protein ParE
MAGRRCTPVFTENFANNLEDVRQFLEPEGQAAFDRLLDRLFDDIVPTLCEFPRSGRPFLVHNVGSLEARALVRRLGGLLLAGDELREFVLDDYLLLYLLRANRVLFLALKHHRQLSFDLDRVWA